MFSDDPKPEKKIKLTEEAKVQRDKAKRKQRIQFITSKIKEMQKQRVFMTAPDMLVVESDEEEVTPA